MLLHCGKKASYYLGEGLSRSDFVFGQHRLSAITFALRSWRPGTSAQLGHTRPPPFAGRRLQSTRSCRLLWTHLDHTGTVACKYAKLLARIFKFITNETLCRFFTGSLLESSVY